MRGGKVKKILVIGSILVVLGLVVGFIVVPALADEPGNAGASYGGVFLDKPMLQRVATTLGLKVDELTSRLKEGQTLGSIASDQKVAEDKVVEAIVKPYQEELQLQVKYDYITQQQADQILAQARERALALMKQDLSGAGQNGDYSWEEMEEYCHGSGEGGWGGMMGGWSGNDNSATASSPAGGGWGGMMGGWGRGVFNRFGGMMGW